MEDNDVFIANVFSPNGDGLNDAVKVEGHGLINISWSIYDRWGNMIFHTDDQSESWDGTYKDKVMDNGTYVYILQATCRISNQKVTIKGNISLLR